MPENKGHTANYRHCVQPVFFSVGCNPSVLPIYSPSPSHRCSMFAALHPHFNATSGGAGWGSGKWTHSKHPGLLRFRYLVPLTKFAVSAQRWTWLRNRIEIQDTARASAPPWLSRLWITRHFNPSMANPPQERDTWNQTRKYLCRRQETRSTLLFSVTEILINNMAKS